MLLQVEQDAAEPVGPNPAEAREPQPVAAEAAREIATASSRLQEQSRELLGPGSELGASGAPLANYVTIAILVAVLLGLRLLGNKLRELYLPRLSRGMFPQAAERMRKAIQQVSTLVVFMAALFVILTFLPTSEPALQKLLWNVYLTLVVVLGGLSLYRLVEIVTALALSRNQEQGTLEQGIGPLLRNVAKVLLFILIVIGVVEAWGYSASGLLAGIGIGGLAIAFAAQDTFSNVFGSFIIYGDKPYRLGDWIRVKEYEGIVEEIGMRSTRIRTFENSLLTVPNRDVTTNTVENFTTRSQRRVKFMLGVTYSTSPEQIEALRDAVTAMLEEHPDVTSRLLGVRFYDFGESSLNVLVSCCVTATDFGAYHRIREEIMLGILRYCNAEGISIAFPTRSLWLENWPAPDSAAVPGDQQ
jgi:MscS family membrane protein